MFKDWQQTIIICVLVIGSVVAGAMHLEALSGTLAGAAAGLVLPGGASALSKAAPVALALLFGGVMWACTPAQSQRAWDVLDCLSSSAPRSIETAADKVHRTIDADGGVDKAGAAIELVGYLGQTSIDTASCVHARALAAHLKEMATPDGGVIQPVDLGLSVDSNRKD